MSTSSSDTKMEIEPKHGLDYEQHGPVIYGLAVVVSVSVWFLAIRAPLWLDETGSYWSISGGFGQIWTRSVDLNSFPAYYYILWLVHAAFGSKELVLRIPSVLAMIAAAYVFYCCARELFAWDVAAIATALFVLDGRIVFAAIDVRPYAFALLTTNLAILSFIRWLKTNSTSYALLFGVACGGIFYFHYLFGCIVAAFAVCYLVNFWHRPVQWKQFGVAAGGFALLIVPVLPRLWYLHQTQQTHVFSDVPPFKVFLLELAPGAVPFVFAGVALVAAFTRKLTVPKRENLRQLLVCLSLALVPAGILYGVTLATPLHIFVERYLGVAIPGLALTWAWILTLVDSRPLRVLCCVVFVTWSAYQSYSSPRASLHGYTWKYALEAADANAFPDGSPLVVCSDLPEADFQKMPAGPASQSVLFSPLSYYRVRTSVVPMPRALNDQARAIGRTFFLRAMLNHQRFVALAFGPSYPTLQWLANLSSLSYTTHVVGVFDGIAVVEFDPQNAGGD